MAQSPFDLTGRTALVTGAGRGLGREIAVALADAGAEVRVGGRTLAPLEATCELIAGRGGRASPLSFDLANETATRNAVQSLERLDILVNAVGMRDRRPLAEFDMPSVRKMIEVNLISAFLISREAAARMERGGRVINLTSIAGPIARAGDAAYTMAKGGLDALTRGLAAELGPKGVTVNAIAPGYFRTEANADYAEDPKVAEWLSRRTALGRWGEPSEIAGAAVFLASDAASYVTGHVLVVDGGYLSHF
jgi:gluconate 5-dehydrogenase